MMQQRAFKFAISTLAAGLVCTASVHVLAAPSGWLNVDGLLQFDSGAGGTYDWANSGPGPNTDCTGTPVVQPSVGGSGGLFNGGQCGVGTAPPTAPTLTPTAAADPSIISAVFVVDPIGGDTGVCNNDPTTLTGGGPKNGDAIASYSWGSGTSSPKTELSNVYAVSHTKANGHPEVYFGAERLVNNGDSHMDFEFMQSVVSTTGNCSAGGGFTGNRTEGDLLFAVDFTNGGALAGFTVYQWHCAAEPGPQPADGTVCNPTGVQHYEAFLATPFASLTVNAAQISCGGWVCRDQVTNDPKTIAANDLVEGGVDLQGIPFTGCFNTFLPHTRSAQSFTSVLQDFAGPLNFKSCRDPATSSTSSPTGAGVSLGSSVTDTVSLTNGGAGPTPTGSVTFLLCGPAQVTASGCPGGTQVGAAKTLVGGGATSDPSSATSAAGKYCWRTVYVPDAGSQGIYEPSAHTNATAECFNVAAPVALPNTGVPEIPFNPWLALQAFLIAPTVLFMLAWRRGRSIALVLMAGVIVGSSPSPTFTSPTPSSAGVAASVQGLVHRAAEPRQLGGVKATAIGWRLVIPRLGVDAQIQSVGKDRSGAMASPASLETVGWFNRGPLPGQAGDAVIAGHLGLPSEPAVFSNLRLLRPGDSVQVVWPDGRLAEFRVTAYELVASSAHPPGVFAKGGPPRLSLITCYGEWDQASRSYTDRLIVTAVRI